MVSMRPIMDWPHRSVSMLALAVGFVLRGIARLNWGAVPMSLPRPYPQTSFMLGPISITSDDLFIALVTILLFSVLTVLLRWLSFGKVIQAIFQTRSEEHTSELQSLMRISYAVFCLKKKKQT